MKDNLTVTTVPFLSHAGDLGVAPLGLLIFSQQHGH